MIKVSQQRRKNIKQALRSVLRDVEPSTQGNPRTEEFIEKILSFSDVWGKNYGVNPDRIKKAEREMNE
jgi:hypothetical protein